MRLAPVVRDFPEYIGIPKKSTCKIYQWPNGSYSLLVRKRTKKPCLFSQGILIGKYFSLEGAKKAAYKWLVKNGRIKGDIKKSCKRVDKTTSKNNSSLIKSKARVRDIGEVFTPDFLVEKMLDQFPKDAWDKNKTWLEPTCGNGAFIIGIIKRKLSLGFDILNAIDTTFGTDIMIDNISECHMRIYKEIVIPYIKQLKIEGNVLKALRWRIACLVENNIRPTKDALQEDFTKWQRFTDRSKEQQQMVKTKIQNVLNMCDNKTDVALIKTALDKRLFKELLILSKGQ